MSSSSVARTSVSYVSPKSRSTSGGEERVLADLDAPVEHASHRRARRRRPCVCDGGARAVARRAALAHDAGGSVVDLVLELVDRRRRIASSESRIRFGDVVDEPVDRGRRPTRRAPRPGASADRSNGASALRDVFRTVTSALGRRDEVDLLVRDAILVRKRASSPRARRRRTRRGSRASGEACATRQLGRQRATSTTSGSTGTGSVASSSSRVGSTRSSQRVVTPREGNERCGRSAGVRRRRPRLRAGGAAPRASAARRARPSCPSRLR